jgi:hypothetical protein
MRTQIKTIIARLQTYGITTFTEANVNYALQATNSEGNGEDAMRLLLLFEDTYEGILKTYNPSTKLLGAENRNGVTCYLDALLFAMFARLDSFEAMLYNSFEDLPRKKLAGLLRLWVNMLRSGRLITRDIVRIIFGHNPSSVADLLFRLNTCKTRSRNAVGNRQPNCASKTHPKPSPSSLASSSSHCSL